MKHISYIFMGCIFATMFIVATLSKASMMSFEWIGLAILLGIILAINKADRERIDELEKKIKELENGNR